MVWFCACDACGCYITLQYYLTLYARWAVDCTDRCPTYSAVDLKCAGNLNPGLCIETYWRFRLLSSFMDDLIPRFDVYKVETISCVYMVVSGVPTRNGDRHVAEIGRMSLDIIRASEKFRINSMPDFRLNLRIGLHTGQYS